MARKKKDRFGQSEEIGFQMAPMIDVVFQLLIFFLCVSTFYKSENVDLVLAYAKMAKEYKRGNDTLVVNVTQKGDIKVNLPGEGLTILTKNALQTVMEGLVAKVGGPNFKVAIRADRKAHMKQIKDIYRAAAHAGLTQISLVTQTRKEGEPVEPGMSLPPEEEGEPGEGTIY